MALKKKELELRLTEASLEQSHSLLSERTELIKQERQVVSLDELIYPIGIISSVDLFVD